MSKLYFSNPRSEPQKILAQLGVWTPEEYKHELQKLGLDEDDITSRMAAFHERHADCANYYRQMLEFDLKRDVSDVHASVKSRRRNQSPRRRAQSQKGGASGFSKVQDNDPHYRPNITGIDMLAKDENLEGTISANYDEDAQRAIRACLDVDVYNIDGKPLPHGKILEECVNIYRAKDDLHQLYHRSLLEAAIECKRKGVSDADMETCVITKTAEMKALLTIQSRILVALRNELQKTEDDMQTLAPGEKSDLKSFEQQNEKAKTVEKQSWTRWIVTQIKNSSIWVAGKGTELALWVIKDPKTAKIVFFILKRLLKDACSYVYTNWLKNEKQYMGMFENFWQRTKNFASSQFELANFAVTAGIQSYFQGNGFKKTWNKAASYLGVAVYGMVGSIPFIGGGIQAVGSIVNEIMFESTQIMIEVAIYENNVKFAGKTFVEILFFLMPVQIVATPQGGYTLQWNQSTESCVGIMRQRETVIGTAPDSHWYDWFSGAKPPGEKLKADAQTAAEAGLLTRVGNPLAGMYTTTQAVGVDVTKDAPMAVPPKPEGTESSGWFPSWFAGGGGVDHRRNSRQKLILPPQLPSNL